MTYNLLQTFTTKEEVLKQLSKKVQSLILKYSQKAIDHDNPETDCMGWLTELDKALSIDWKINKHIAYCKQVINKLETIEVRA